MPAAERAPGEGSRPHLELALASIGGATRLVRCVSRAPLRVFRLVKTTGPGGAGGAGARGPVEVPLVHLGGGLLPGESLDVVVRVGAGAAARFTSVGATHLYPPPAGAGGAPAELRVALEVEAGALVEWVPEPLVPHAGARYRQRSTVLLHPKASLFYADCLVAGRNEEEAFSWDELALRTEIAAPDGSLQAVDALRLAPRRGAARGLSPGPPAGPLPGPQPGLASFASRRALASVLMVADGAILDRLAADLAALLHGPAAGDANSRSPAANPSAGLQAPLARAGVLGGVSRLPGGVGLSIRLLAPGGGAAVAAVRAVLACWEEGVLPGRTEEGPSRTPPS